MSQHIEKTLMAVDDSERFHIELAFRIYVELGENEVVGEVYDGFRRNYPIKGGYFIGPNISGEVVPGGADVSLERKDGVVEIDAIYRLKANNGQIILVDNKGIWRKATAEDNSKDGQYLRTNPKFIAPEGPHEWLNKSMFVGVVDDFEGDNTLIVSIYRVSGY